jgi:HAD superfamily hydrolase (TIGR01549 family)
MDGTLFGYDDVVASINSEFKVIEAVSKLVDSDCVSELNITLQQCFDVDRKIWFEKFLKALDYGTPDSRKKLGTDLEQLYWLYFSKYNTPYADALYFLDLIKDYCVICMITDGYTYNQKIKLQASNLHTYFPADKVVFSDDVGKKKPDPRIFQEAFSKFSATPDSSIYIGDKIEKDIRGSNNIGMRSILLRRGKNSFQPVGDNISDTPTITVYNYYELMKRCRFEG